MNTMIIKNNVLLLSIYGVFVLMLYILHLPEKIYITDPVIPTYIKSSYIDLKKLNNNELMYTIGNTKVFCKKHSVDNVTIIYKYGGASMWNCKNGFRYAYINNNMFYPSIIVSKELKFICSPIDKCNKYMNGLRGINTVLYT